MSTPDEINGLVLKESPVFKTECSTGIRVNNVLLTSKEGKDARVVVDLRPTNSDTLVTVTYRKPDNSNTIILENPDHSDIPTMNQGKVLGSLRVIEAYTSPEDFALLLAHLSVTREAYQRAIENPRWYF